MSKKLTSVSQVARPQLKESHELLKRKLQNRIEKGLELKLQVSTRADYEELKSRYYRWDAFNVELLKQSFDSDEVASEYSGFGFGLTDSTSLGELIAGLHKEIDHSIHRLASIMDRLELFPVIGHDGVSPLAKESLSTFSSKKVFIVHGHDEVAKANLEIFLHENGLEPIVLHRQADQGLTIIEKFERYSDVSYAFIILTPDEIAYLAADAVKPDTQRNKEFRARPNVIFEFGYFVGRLTRARVCCLYTGNVTLPSDISGMIYKRYERSIEEVGYSIIKDLRTAGLLPI